MERICPNCDSSLGSYDKFFCSSCGFVLPQDLILQEKKTSFINEISPTVVSKSKPTKDIKKASKKSIKVDLKALVLSIGAPLFIFAMYLLIKDINFTNMVNVENNALAVDQQVETSVIVPEEDLDTTYIEISNAFTSDYLSFDSFLSAVPSDTVLYLYGLRLNEFTETLKESFNVDVEGPFVEVPSNTFSFLVKQKIENNLEWALILNKQSELISTEEVTSINLDNSFTVYSNSDEFLAEITGAYKNTVRNLKQNAKLVLALEDISQSERVGKMFIYVDSNGKQLLQDVCDTNEVSIFTEFCKLEGNYVLIK